MGIDYKQDNSLNYRVSYILSLSNNNDIGSVTNKNGMLQLSIGYFF